MTDAERKPRRDLTDDEIAKLKDLYRAVPVEIKEWRLWTTPEGKTFIANATAVRDNGVPVAWMAQSLEMDDRILLQILHRERRKERYRPGRSPRKGERQ